MIRRTLLIAAAMVLLLSLLACNLGGIGGQSAEEEVAAPETTEMEGGEEMEVPPEEVEAPDEEEPQPPDEELPPPPEADQEVLDLSDITEGLGGLNSYKSTFALGFVGTDEQGNPVDGIWDYTEWAIREPAAQRISFATTGFEQGDTGELGMFEMVTIGDTSYMVTEDEDGTRSCISMSSDESTGLESGWFSPETMGGISGAQYVGTEMVNGIETKHYTWSESGISGWGFANASGELWQAVDGEYTVKYTAEASGQGAIMGPEWEGTLTVEYNLTEPNGSFVIEPPADCQTATSDIPVMPDAYDKASFGEMQSYTSPSPFDTVRMFYEAEMVANGWELGGKPMAMEGFITLDFVKDGRTAQVMITYDEGTQATSVIITTNEG
jgi:hypothetical protein